MSKVVTPTFFVSHNVFFGNPQFPSGHYQVYTSRDILVCGVARDRLVSYGVVRACVVLLSVDLV